jgi:hypothetical protein
MNIYVYTNSSFCTRFQYSPFCVAISAQLHKEMFIILYIHYIHYISFKFEEGNHQFKIQSFEFIYVYQIERFIYLFALKKKSHHNSQHKFQGFTRILFFSIFKGDDFIKWSDPSLQIMSFAFSVAIYQNQS